MEDVKKLILNTINKNPKKKVGVNFLVDYLDKTYVERVIEGRRVKFSLLSLFRTNVYNCPQMIASEKQWLDAQNHGLVASALVSAFDWDRTTEGFDFWAEVNNTFIETLQKAKTKGLKVDSTIDDSADATEDIRIMPTDITLDLIKYLNPLCEHLNKVIDVLLTKLRDLNCLDSFFANLRCKPKRDGYEEQFKSYLRGEDIRGIIYWAFNWVSTKEGFDYWSNISSEVTQYITNEFVVPKAREEILKKDPISHVSNGSPIYHQPAHTVTRPNPYQSYDPQARWDEDDCCDWWARYRRTEYYSSSLVPKDIADMPITKSIIKTLPKLVVSIAE